MHLSASTKHSTAGVRTVCTTAPYLGALVHALEGGNLQRGDLGLNEASVTDGATQLAVLHHCKLNLHNLRADQ